MKRYRRQRRYKKVSKILGTKDLIDRSKIKHKNTYTYTKTKIIPGKEQVDVICKIHGGFKIKPKRLLARRGGCPKCRSLSNGEIKTSLFLLKNKIKYVPEYKLPEYKWRYDFYLPELKIVIEYDGIQHFKAIRKFGGEKILEASKQRDKDKDNLAALHGLRMIRIPYTKYDVLEEYLLFKLSKIYKYRVGKKFYKTFGEVCEDLKLPGDTKPSNITKHLTYIK